MEIMENFPLRKLNTFGMDVRARHYAEIDSIETLNEVLAHKNFNMLPRLVLGGGSNILFTGDYDGLVLGVKLKGINLIRQTDGHFFVKAAAGESWHEFVKHCIQKNYAGIENLSLIPGNAGAAPIQNIGAYGVELKDVFHELEAWSFQDNTIRTFSPDECRFGYRDSFFKQEGKDNYLITSVTLRLNKVPVFNTSYGAIREELDKMGVKELSIPAISQAVINIRSSKLPDPAKIGNAGSFFKNPVVSNAVFSSLKKEFPDIVGYRNEDTEMKLAAGWLVEKCGWKGFREDDYGVHKQQALVLVNYGNSKGSDIYELSVRIIESVREKFGVVLEREVNVV